jgi:hypothetical protein
VTEIKDSGRLVPGRDINGQAREWRLQIGRRIDLPGSGLVTTTAELADGTPLVRRGLPADADSHTGAERLLDNEIRSLVRLARAYPDRADMFPGTVGYDIDAVAPFLLVSRYRGLPAAEVATTLLDAQRIKFAGNLFRALVRLADVGLVHGRLRLSSMHADGPDVQIVTWEQAAVIGERRPDGEIAHPGDDVLAAARLLYEVFYGAPLHKPDDLVNVPLLHSLLSGALDPDPARRPPADLLLERLGVAPDPDTRPAELEKTLNSGRQRFEQIRQHKRSAAGVQDPPNVPVPMRSTATGAHRRALPIAVIVLVLIVLTVVTLLVVRP